MELTYIAIISVVSLALILLAFYFKFKFSYAIAGLLLIIMGLAIGATGIQYNKLVSENTTLIYGNETIHLQVLNESENVTAFPWLFSTIYTPLVNGSNVCYYTDNLTSLNSTIVDLNLGIINITS